MERSRGIGVDLGAGVGVGVGVDVDGWYVKVQVNSGVPPMLQLKAPGGMCMTLRPCTAGDVLKWKIIPK